MDVYLLVDIGVIVLLLFIICYENIKRDVNYVLIEVERDVLLVIGLVLWVFGWILVDFILNGIVL